MTPLTDKSALTLPEGYADWLARDLKDAFADMRGCSPRNLKYMLFFAEHRPDGLF